MRRNEGLQLEFDTITRTRTNPCNLHFAPPGARLLAVGENLPQGRSKSPDVASAGPVDLLPRAVQFDGDPGKPLPIMKRALSIDRLIDGDAKGVILFFRVGRNARIRQFDSDGPIRSGGHHDVAAADVAMDEIILSLIN
jgi:hypothetical protein